jgi:ribonucleoside-diphosphate reductase alpha chain
MDALNKNMLQSQYSLIVNDTVEEYDEIIDRVARTISSIEQDTALYYEKYKWIIDNNLFIPAGRILNNAGSKQSQMASCFVLPIKDDFNSIFDTLKASANCHRLGGGTGFNFSKIREKGRTINTSEASGASGPVSWLKLFDAETRVVMSGGKNRGANIAILNVYHPDIIEFINCKNDFGLKNFSISVLMDNHFIECLRNEKEISLISPFDNSVCETIPAKTAWDNIIRQIHKTGEPGLLFQDTINDSNPIKDKFGKLEISNPCGEQIMYADESSFLGSINLSNLFIEDKKDIDWDLFKELIQSGIRFLDAAIDVNKYPDKNIEKVSRSYRRIGLGVMGFADLLFKLKIPYNSAENLKLIRRIGAVLKEYSDKTTELLGKEKGNFPYIKRTSFKGFRRNIATRAIAPTGTISLIAGCSNGIDPKFLPYYKKNVIEDDGIIIYDKTLIEILIEKTHKNQAEVESIILNNTYENYLNEREKSYLVYLNQISYEWQIKIMAEWQKYIDNGISKTINIPNNSTLEDVDEILKLAISNRCKGITVYRQGSHPQDIIFKPEEQIIQSKTKHKLVNTLKA